MDFLFPLLLGVGLAMDCFAVSLAAAGSAPLRRARLALTLGATFGVFQAGMLLAGWAAGSTLAGFFSGYDHWVAFLLLLAIGARMICSGLRGGEGGDNRDYLAMGTVLVLALATSMDALGAGMGMGFLSEGALFTSMIVALVTFLFSCAGALLGGTLAKELGERFEVLGGVILVGIGMRILIEHLATM
jgi:putative Mn2+ efflux pump MntP